MKVQQTKNKLLGGIQILDLSDEKASFCTKLLADIGARVIKIERPGGDPSRKHRPFWGKASHPENSLSFCYNNTNKLGITLNLEHDDGKLLFSRLVERTDIVVESFYPGDLEKLGLGFEVLKKINPALILVSITGFGQEGPRKGFKSSDLVASAFGGQMYVTGISTAKPLKLYGQQPSLIASLFGATGILLALRKRRRSGKGEHIDISIQEAVTASLEHVMVRFFHENIIPARQGNLHWNHLFHIFPCKDGFIQITLFEGWETLVEWMDSEGMAENLKDEKWRDEQYRRKHIDHIIKVLGKWTKTHTNNELFELGQLMRFSWAPVQTPEQITGCPQLKTREFFVNIEHPEEGDILKYPWVPYKFRPPITTPYKRAPRIGEDNVQIYNKELGVSKNKLNMLSASGVI